MPPPLRFILPPNVANSTSWDLALKYAHRSFNNVGKSGGTVVLMTPTLSQLKHTNLAAELGDNLAKRLSNRETIEIVPGWDLHHATPRTRIGYSAGSVIIAYYYDDAMLEKIDAMIGLAGVIVVPDCREDVEGWEERWTPTVHGEAKKQPTQILTDPVVEKALEQLTRGINRSSGALHPTDKEKTTELLKILRAKGHLLEPDQLKSWAIKHGWNPPTAEELRKLASKIHSLKSRPSLGNIHNAQSRYENWCK